MHTRQTILNITNAKFKKMFFYSLARETNNCKVGNSKIMKAESSTCSEVFLDNDDRDLLPIELGKRRSSDEVSLDMEPMNDVYESKQTQRSTEDYLSDEWRQ